jgi:hypothetical protein
MPTKEEIYTEIFQFYFPWWFFERSKLVKTKTYK